MRALDLDSIVLDHGKHATPDDGMCGGRDRPRGGGAVEGAAMTTRDDWAAAGSTLGMCLRLLETHDWDRLAETIELADRVGPVLHPSAYREALFSGRLDTNRRAVAAVRMFLAAVRPLIPSGTVDRREVAE